MSDYEISAEAVGAAARALAVQDGYRQWDTLFPERRQEYLRKARAALIVAAPLIAAAARRAEQQKAAQEIADMIEELEQDTHLFDATSIQAATKLARDYGAEVHGG